MTVNCGPLINAPLSIRGGTLTVGVINPSEEQRRRKIRAHEQYEIEIMVAHDLRMVEIRHIQGTLKSPNLSAHKGCNQVGGPMAAWPPRAPGPLDPGPGQSRGKAWPSLFGPSAKVRECRAEVMQTAGLY